MSAQPTKLVNIMAKIRKSGAHRLDESFVNARRREPKVTKTREELYQEWIEGRKLDLGAALHGFLFNACRKKPTEERMVERDYEGRIVTDSEGRPKYYTGVNHAFDYVRFCDALAVVVRKFRPDELYDGQTYRFCLNERQDDIPTSKNQIWLEKSPGGEWVAVTSKATDYDIDEMRRNSLFCARIVLSIAKFYLISRLCLTKSEQQAAAEFINTHYRELTDI